MINEELYIITDNGRERLDLPSPSGITLKWVSNLFNDISKLTCSYSYTFKLPMTANNRRVFGIAEDIRRESNYTRKAVDAEFYINGVCLCPNANLYVSEIGSAYSCVMTWRVLKAFETLKNDKGKLTELPSLGRINWGSDETYGGTSDDTSNMDAVVYPDYDAGVPHEKGTPPKPCVPVYKIIQLINDTFGVKFNIGTMMSNGMGKKPNSYLNNYGYYGKRVYDDYISNGVIPLVNSTINGAKYAVRGIYGIGDFALKTKTLDYTQKWSVVRFGTGTKSNPYYVLHYGITEGTYTSLKEQNSEQIQAEYQKPKTVAIGIAVFDEFRGNDFVKPVFGYLHDTGLSFYNKVKGERNGVNDRIDTLHHSWGTRTYAGTEQISLQVSTDKSSLQGWSTYAECTEDTTREHVYSGKGGDAGSLIGVVGFYTRNAFSLKGYCELHIARSAVEAGRVDISGYQWMCLAKKSADKDDELEAVTDKDISKYVGFQSIDKPVYEAPSDTYVCHFDFGKSYDARKIEIDADDDENLQTYMFLPYIPDDHMKEITIPADDENGTETTETILNLQEGDLYFEGFCISELMPSVEVATLPVKIQVTESLPDVTCFDFVKSVFYMNGALPRVERDGKTISAVYYNMLRDNVNDGKAIDWSKKLLSSGGEVASSIKFRNSNFAKVNYLEMASSNADKTEDELAEELDVYGDGYGSFTVDDDTLNETTSIFRSCFYPAYIQNMRFPLVKTGKTCKVWEGDKTLVDDVKPIYGVMVYRVLDPQIEDANADRPGALSATDYSKRMNVFSPFDDEKMMSKLFGYYLAILNNYRIVKEKFLLNEIDLRDFDESKPVYLSKYNAYFAVSTIQRDKNGISTVELVKLPRAVDETETIITDYEVELLSSGYIQVDAGAGDSSAIYFKRSENSDWEVLSSGKIEVFGSGIYAVTADNAQSDNPVLRLFLSYVGQYRYTYTDSDTGEKKSIVRSESSAYYDEEEWSKNTSSDYPLNGFHAIYEGDEDWHRVSIVIPIRNQFGEIVETRKWTSPIFVASKELANYKEDEVRVSVVTGNVMKVSINLERTYTSNPCPIMADGGSFSYNRNEMTIGAGWPTWAEPDLEGENYMKNDSYTLTHSLQNAIPYKVVKRKGFDIVSTKQLSAKLRVYYDDVRVTEGRTLTFNKNGFGQHHAFKFIADLVDEDGTLLKKLRRRMLWFVYGKDNNALNEPFGDEHDADATVKVNDVSIYGDSSIADKVEHKYTLSYSPSYADINVKSVDVSVGNRATYLIVSNVSTSGFTLTAKDLPENETNVQIIVTVLLEDGSSFTKEKPISILMPSITLVRYNAAVGNFTIDSVNGEGSGVFGVVVRPYNTSNGKVVSVKTSNDKVAPQGIKGNHFTLYASGVTEDMSVDVTVTAEYNGMTMSGVFAISVSYIDVWTTDALDKRGLLIVDRNGRLYTSDEWKNSGNENDDADGVAVSDGTHRFVISKKNVLSGTHSTGNGTLLDGLFTTTDEATALTDFAGKAGTDTMVAALADSFAHDIRSQSRFPSGKEAYCGALGEWKIISDNRTAINNLMKVIGGDELFYVSNFCDYWSVTQYNGYCMWAAHFGANVEYWFLHKDTNQYLRPLAEIPENTTPVKDGYMSITGEDSFAAKNGSGSALFGVSYGPDGVSVSEVSMASSNDAVVLAQVSNEQFRLSVSGILIDEVTTVTVKARLNNMMRTVTKVITAVGETVVDYDKLDKEHALILGTDCTLYTEDEWVAAKKEKKDIEGIAVSDSTHRLIVALDDISERCRFGGRGKAVVGLSSSTSEFDGETNTICIVNSITSSDGYFTAAPYSAAGLARNYRFPTGKAGFLASCAEWKMVGQYIDEIEDLLSLVGGTSLIKTFSKTYWVSTGVNYDIDIRTYMCSCYRSDSDNTVKFSAVSQGFRSDLSLVRPFRNF